MAQAGLRLRMISLFSRSSPGLLPTMTTRHGVAAGVVSVTSPWSWLTMA